MTKQITHCSRPLQRRVITSNFDDLPSDIIYTFHAIRGDIGVPAIYEFHFERKHTYLTIRDNEYKWRAKRLETTEAITKDGFQPVELIKLDKPKFAVDAFKSMLPGKETVYIGGIIVRSGATIGN